MNFEHYLNTPSNWNGWYYLNDDDKVMQCQNFDDFQRFAREKWPWESDKPGARPIVDYHETCRYCVGYKTVGRYRVCTDFLGLDHGFGSDVPIVWETMIFGNGCLDDFQDRTPGERADAKIMHDLAVIRAENVTWLEEWHGCNCEWMP